MPRFNVEQKKFHVIKCNFDLAETELEINVVRGIAYHVSKPKDIDTYVRVEFAYPQVTSSTLIQTKFHMIINKKKKQNLITGNAL